MRATSLIPLSVLCAAVAAIASADESDDLKTSPVAEAFGSALIWGAELSPDGERLSLIQVHPSGASLARVMDITTGDVTSLIAGTRDSDLLPDVAWCDWANTTRLVCGLRALGMRRPSASYAPYAPYASRIYGVDSDGGSLEPLSGVRVIDWLPDDQDRVLVVVGNPNGRGIGVAKINVHNGAVTDEVSGPIQIVHWETDGLGAPRLYRRILGKDSWYVRDTPDADWSLLHETELTDTEDAFVPVGFGQRRNELLFFDDHEGRLALFGLDLENNRSRHLIYAHESLDVAAVYTLGRYNRFVAVSYIDDKLRFKFFDERVEKIHTAVQALFVGKNVSIVDEDWDQRYYLIFVDGTDDPGTYYRFDSQHKVLLNLVHTRPRLVGRELAPVRAFSYPAGDGTQIPAYLTMPRTSSDDLPPAVVLPHDGPQGRDYLRFDFLAQYLAAHGYAVLQINYRGSAGYGDEWEGEGGYRDWRRAISDIADGTEHLAHEGIADARRICIVGWGYGGYTALMSVIEHSGLYRCVVSIAGVTDPRAHGAALNYLGGAAERAFVGTDDDVLDAGSPLKRVEEIGVPALLFHGERDVDVRLAQSTDFARALKRAGKDWELVRYEDAEHDIRQERYRIDLLTRLAAFLDSRLSE